jgi:hypothetical protein
MKITRTVLHGAAAGVDPPLTVDSNDLVAADASALRRLVAAAKVEPTRKSSGGMREEITIDDNGATTTMDQSVTDMTPAFAALRKWMTEHSQRNG